MFLYELHSLYSMVFDAGHCFVVMPAGGDRWVLGRAFSSPTVRRALFVGCGLQVFQQVSGINTVMYYSASIIKMAGVRDNGTAIWLAAVTAGVNFLFTLVGLALVDRLGRRKLTLGSLVGTYSYVECLLTIVMSYTCIRRERTFFFQFFLQDNVSHYYML